MADFPRLTIPFEGAPARAIRVPVDVDAREALAALDLPPYRAIVVMHGGAGGMEPELIDDVARFFALSLAPFAEQHRVLIAVDAHLSDRLDVSGFLAFFPERLART